MLIKVYYGLQRDSRLINDAHNKTINVHFSKNAMHSITEQRLQFSMRKENRNLTLSRFNNYHGRTDIKIIFFYLLLFHAVSHTTSIKV